MFKESESKKFTTREWIFVFIIASLVQGAVWYISFVNAGNPSALTYVSFAGTLISIILAVLAIGYTYGESVSQKNKSDNVASQIESLNGVIKNIEIGSESLNKISDISNDLKIFHNHFKGEMEKNNSYILKINESLSKMKVKANSDSPNINPSVFYKSDKNKILNVLLDGKDDTFYVGFLMNYYSALSERKSDEDTKFFMSSLDEVLNTVEDSDGVNYSAVSFFIAVQDVLFRLGIVNFNDGIEFNKDVEINFNEIKEKATSIKTNNLWRKCLIGILISGIEKKINQ